MSKTFPNLMKTINHRSQNLHEPQTQETLNNITLNCLSLVIKRNLNIQGRKTFCIKNSTPHHQKKKKKEKE